MVIAILIIVIISTLSEQRSFEDTYDTYIEATMSCDAESVVNLLHDYYITDLIEDGEVIDREDLIRKVQKKLDWYSSRAEAQGGSSYEFVAELQHLNDVNVDNNISFELKSICGDSLKKLKKAKYASIYYNMYSDDLSLGFSLDRTIYTESIYFIKIGQSWYLGNISKLNQFW